MTPLDLENGQDDEEEKPKRGPGRPKKTESVAGLETEMKEQLEELAEWIKRRDPELAETFLEDVGRMAKFLATRAGKHARLARVLKILFAKDGPLAGLRAFGRTARMFGLRINARRERALDAGEWPKFNEADGNWYDANGNIVVPGN